MRSQETKPSPPTALAFVCLVVACCSPLVATERPNVVVLLADDLGLKDIGCYGGPVKTPVLDGLAADGVRFKDFYSGAPVCSPARAVLMTGRQHMRTGVYTVIQDHLHDMHLLKREVTIAEHLQANGYQTVHLGKWHLGTPFRGRKKPWIDEHGFDYWFATDLNAAPSHRDPVNFWRNRQRVGKIEGYACQIVVDEAITWLDDKRDAEEPFFLNVWFHEPHAPLAAPADIVSEYGNANEPAAIYSATIDNTDRAIGRLVRKLKDIGEFDNTIIFYTSDHGSYRPERNGELKGNKGSLFEGGIRTPGIFHWPNGIKGGRTEIKPGGAVDLLPTICGLVGIQPPKAKSDGTNLAPLLTGNGKFERNVPLFWDAPLTQPIVIVRDGHYSLAAYRKLEYPRDQKKIAELMSRMEKILQEELKPEKDFTREELWRSCWNYECKREDWRKLRAQFVTLNTFQESWCPLIKDGSGGFTRFELYDLKRDPNQTRDVSRRFPKELNRLKQRAIAIHRELMHEAVDWSDPADVIAREKSGSSVEETMRIHRLTSQKRSIYDAFAYINRIPEAVQDGETVEDLAGRIFSRLANQEGRVLLKAPPGMSVKAYDGYKLFMRDNGTNRVGNCIACHQPQDFTDGKLHVVTPGGNAQKTPALRNLLSKNVDLRKAIQTKLSTAKQKQSGEADDVANAYSSIRLTDDDAASIVEFLKLLEDVPNNRFRKLILDAKVLPVGQ